MEKLTNETIKKINESEILVEIAECMVSGNDFTFAGVDNSGKAIIGSLFDTIEKGAEFYNHIAKHACSEVKGITNENEKSQYAVIITEMGNALIEKCKNPYSLILLGESVEKVGIVATGKMDFMARSALLLKSMISNLESEDKMSLSILLAMAITSYIKHQNITTSLSRECLASSRMGVALCALEDINLKAFRLDGKAMSWADLFDRVEVIDSPETPETHH